MNKRIKWLFAIVCMLETVNVFAQLEQPIYKNQKFAIYPNKIIQEEKIYRHR